MGRGIASRLLHGGRPLLVFDLDAAACRQLQDEGAQVAASAVEVARAAEVVFLCLPSVAAQQQVAAAIAQEPGPLAVRAVVDCSTVGPEAVRRLQRDLQPRGIAVLDAPVSGGARGAQAGTLSIMCAGPRAARDAAMPLLRAISDVIFDLGPEPGAAQLCKLANNAVSAAGMVAACEAMVLGVKAGLPADTLLAAINAGSGRNVATEQKLPRHVLTGSFDFGGPIGLMLKDLQLYLEQAGALGVPGTMTAATLAAWQRAVDRTGPAADYTQLIQPLEQDAGVLVRNPTQA